MQVVLKEDIKEVGKKGESIKVADGYAKNYLFPRGLAIVANSSTMKVIEKEKRDSHVKLMRDKKEAEKLALLLASKPITIVVDAGELGRMYGSITHKDVAENIKKTFNVEIDKKKIELDEEHLKEMGEHFAVVKLHPEVRAQVTLKIIAKEVHSSGNDEHQHHHHTKK